jgi:hypothetical protein
LELLGDNFEPLPTGQELIDYWIKNLVQGESVIFGLLVEAYPDIISRESITEKTGYQRSTRDAYIQRLERRKLVRALSKGLVIASEKLFN